LGLGAGEYRFIRKLLMSLGQGQPMGHWECETAVINFSGISSSGLSGRALRLPLQLVPREAGVRILQGPLWERWIAGSSNHG
jgi:hypothetical protein